MENSFLSDRYPDGSPSHPTIFDNWLKLLASAKKSIKIASSYWSMRNADVDDLGTNTSWQGERIFREIFDAGKNRGIKIQIAQDKPKRTSPDDDTALLVRGKEPYRKVKRVTGPLPCGLCVCHSEKT